MLHPVQSKVNGMVSNPLQFYKIFEKKEIKTKSWDGDMLTYAGVAVVKPEIILGPWQASETPMFHYLSIRISKVRYQE